MGCSEQRIKFKEHLKLEGFLPGLSLGEDPLFSCGLRQSWVSLD